MAWLIASLGGIFKETEQKFRWISHPNCDVKTQTPNAKKKKKKIANKMDTLKYTELLMLV